jgi:hypothetical protein
LKTKGYKNCANKNIITRIRTSSMPAANPNLLYQIRKVSDCMDPINNKHMTAISVSIAAFRIDKN